MQIFAAVKAAVTTREAAVFYGLRVPANGMICCPLSPRQASLHESGCTVLLLRLS